MSGCGTRSFHKITTLPLVMKHRLVFFVKSFPIGSRLPLAGASLGLWRRRRFSRPSTSAPAPPRPVPATPTPPPPRPAVAAQPRRPRPARGTLTRCSEACVRRPKPPRSRPPFQAPPLRVTDSDSTIGDECNSTTCGSVGRSSSNAARSGTLEKTSERDEIDRVD